MVFVVLRTGSNVLKIGITSLDEEFQMTWIKSVFDMNKNQNNPESSEKMKFFQS